MKEIEIKIGGIYYKVEVDIDDDYIVKVLAVSVWDSREYHKIQMLNSELNTFYKFYEDLLNEGWQETKANEENYWKSKGE